MSICGLPGFVASLDMRLQDIGSMIFVFLRCTSPRCSQGGFNGHRVVFDLEFRHAYVGNGDECLSHFMSTQRHRRGNT